MSIGQSIARAVSLKERQKATNRRKLLAFRPRRSHVEPSMASVTPVVLLGDHSKRLGRLMLWATAPPSADQQRSKSPRGRAVAEFFAGIGLGENDSPPKSARISGYAYEHMLVHPSLYFPNVPLRDFIHTRFVDRRANRIERIEIRHAGDGFECVAAAPVEASRQIEDALGPCGATRLEQAEGLGRDWTDAWRLQREPDRRLRAGLDFMPSVLYLCVRSPLVAAVALDWYKLPPVENEGFDDTPVGSMINAAKYRGIAEARAELVGGMAKVLNQHPAFTSVDTVLSVPGSTPTSNFSIKFAHDVAKAAGLPIVDGCARQANRPPAKEQAHDEAEEALAGRFYVRDRLDEQTVCIVDDVFRRGRTMRAIAHGATAAGASRCIGLAAARTLSGVT